MRPTPRTVRLLLAGFAVAILPALGWPAAWPLVLVMWAALAVVLGADALRATAAAHVRWRLDMPAALYVGARATLGLHVTIQADRPVDVEAALGLSDDLPTPPPARGTTAAGALSLAWDVTPPRRGVATVESVWLRVSSPLKLWTRWIVETVDRDVPVLPNLPEVEAAAVRFFADREFRAGLKIERYRGDGSEFDSLKEFLAGDDHRAMDWKSSARHRRLLCRQHRAERNHQVILAIDTGRLMSESLHGMSRMDHALNAALLLAYVCLKSGDRVGLFTFDARPGVSLPPVQGVGGMRALVEAAARVHYSRDETNFTLGLTRLSQQLHRRSLVILLTDFSDTVTAGLMLDHLARIARRHVIMFVSLRDPVMEGLAGSPPADLETLGRAVVARDLIRDRERVHVGLKRMGVAALDVPPDRIATGLINQYLDIKRRERV